MTIDVDVHLGDGNEAIFKLHDTKIYNDEYKWMIWMIIIIDQH